MELRSVTDGLTGPILFLLFSFVNQTINQLAESVRPDLGNRIVHNHTCEPNIYPVV